MTTACQNIAEGKNSYKLGWKVKVVTKKQRKNALILKGLYWPPLEYPKLLNSKTGWIELAVLTVRLEVASHIASTGGNDVRFHIGDVILLLRFRIM